MLKDDADFRTGVGKRFLVLASTRPLASILSGRGKKGGSEKRRKVERNVALKIGIKRKMTEQMAIVCTSEVRTQFPLQKQS